MGVPVLGHLLRCAADRTPAGRQEWRQRLSANTAGRKSTVDDKSGLFRDVADTTICWMSHTDYISQAPEGFRSNGAYAGMPGGSHGESVTVSIYALQPHPEVMHTVEGTKMLECIRQRCLRMQRRLADGIFRGGYDKG